MGCAIASSYAYDLINFQELSSEEAYKPSDDDAHQSPYDVNGLQGPLLLGISVVDGIPPKLHFVPVAPHLRHLGPQIGHVLCIQLCSLLQIADILLDYSKRTNPCLDRLQGKSIRCGSSLKLGDCL